MKNTAKKRLHIEKIKVARLNNPQDIVGGSITAPLVTVTCDTNCDTNFSCIQTHDCSTKTHPISTLIEGI